MTHQFNRRHFLRGSGALIALPALESIGFVPFAAAAESAKPAKRAVFLGMGFGVTKETWYPDKEDSGADYQLSEGLAPLARHKKDFTIVQGCTNKFSNEAHWGSTFWLTGANRYAVAGQSMANSISADQAIALQLGQDTRFTSIQLDSGDKTNSGHGPGLSLAWDQRGKPVAGFDNPATMFHKLFSADDMPLDKRKAAIAENRSVLDAVHVEAKRVQRGLTKTDTDKLDEYFQGIRDIETRLSKDEEWLEVPKAKAPLGKPAPNLKGRPEIEIMYQLIVAALQTDSTRVITYRMPGQSLLRSMDIGHSAHNISHYSPGVRMEASQARDREHARLLAGLIDKLKATKEADGSSLFDHTSLAFGSNISSIHYLDNCPTVLTGGGANLKLGQHLVLHKDTPLCNVWLTMMHGMGVKAERHGDSSDVVKELQG
jgi:hypothetical protein